MFIIFIRSLCEKKDSSNKKHEIEDKEEVEDNRTEYTDPENELAIC